MAKNCLIWEVSKWGSRVVMRQHLLLAVVSWGRCYDHNFLRFLPIFGEKIGFFLKIQCYDKKFAQFSFVLSQKRQFFRRFFSAKIFRMTL
jgi:hypothetical protein